MINNQINKGSGNTFCQNFCDNYSPFAGNVVY